MLILIAAFLHAEPNATLFVDVRGSFFLNVDLQQRWNQAELTFDQSLGLFTKNDIQHFSYEGTFDQIPSVLNMNVSVSKDSVGAYSSLPIPVIYLPLSHPNLSGEEDYALPSQTFKWKLYKNIVRPVTSWLKHE